MQAPPFSLASASLPPLLLSLLPGIGAGRYWDYVTQLGSAANVLHADPATLPRLPANAKTLLVDYQRYGKQSDLTSMAEQMINAAIKHQARIITIDDADYPPQLKRIYRAPPVLFTKGNEDLLSHPQIAIIGTRNPTHSGIENTQSFSRYLAKAGFTITSGLALGIDGVAHRAAAEEMGKTIAVMATGIDAVYPSRHRELAEYILNSGGLLITEFAPNTPPLAARFPQRNRIISGLSIGTLIIEAAIKSGSLITASYALEQNREVFCIPGSIHNPQSKGCHKLIKEGAHLVETADDIVQHCQGTLNTMKSHANFTEERLPAVDLSVLEKAILDVMQHEPQNLDTVISRCGFTASDVSANLVLLELKGAVTQSMWGYELSHKNRQDT